MSPTVDPTARKKKQEFPLNFLPSIKSDSLVKNLTCVEIVRESKLTRTLSQRENSEWKKEDFNAIYTLRKKRMQI